MSRAQRTYAERREWQAPEGYGFKANEPTAGYYKIRLGHETVLRALHLFYGPPLDPVTGEELDRSWRWMAVLDDGGLLDIDIAWPKCGKLPIEEAEYRRCCSRTAWARKQAPESAYAQRGRKLDPLSTSTPLPF